MRPTDEVMPEVTPHLPRRFPSELPWKPGGYVLPGRVTHTRLTLSSLVWSRFSRAALWIGTTSFMILVLPVVFETEKLQMEQQQQLQQRQVRGWGWV